LLVNCAERFDLHQELVARIHYLHPSLFDNVKITLVHLVLAVLSDDLLELDCI